MLTKHKISLAVSLALTVFFVFPWITLAGEINNLGKFVPEESVKMRLVYMATTVFVISLIMFYHNFFWKLQLPRPKQNWLGWIQDAAINILLVLVLSGSLLLITEQLFGVPSVRTYLILYVFRNTSIAFVAVMVNYVYKLVETSKSDKIRILSLNKERAETELAILKTQIDPHFLFNTLNSLTSLIRQNGKEAIEFVGHLSETFRYTLEHRKEDVVTVKKELAFLESYIFMMKIRFADGLDIHIKVKDTHLSRKIPQFALQLLIENAVKHNRISERSPLVIGIESNDEHLMVVNNLQAKLPSSGGYGIGLANLSKRYLLLAGLDIQVYKNESKFEVKLPLL